ncbi:MAG: hypothetical protein HOO88_05480 [Kiritimatiellaceae bacterium]|nr:hypothetical protein [Kiritimatiellaceae bacterium]
MIASQWLKQAIGAEHDISVLLRHDGLIFATDRKRLHSLLGGPDEVGGKASAGVTC